MRLSAIFGLFIALFPSLSQGGTWVPFGPETYVRASGPPASVTRSFSILNPNTTYTLRINNGGLHGELAKTSSGQITLNGIQIVSPNEFNQGVSVIEKPIQLVSNNQLVINLRGAPGSGIALQAIGVDNDPPRISGTITPAPNGAGWNHSNVMVSFTCSDQTSGVALCPSPVAVTTEGSNQVVTGTATDKAGNTATASVIVNLDKTPPITVGSISPPPDAAGWNSSNVTVSFTCSDALSGVASCSSPVAVTTEGANQVVKGTATDLAGNTATTNVTVNISRLFFSVRNYGGKCLDYGPSWQETGPTVFLNDCALAHSIRVEEINDKHEVILHAGMNVIGIHNPPVNTQGGPPPPPQTEFALELQQYNPILASTANQIFRLDGDSIILESRLPCINTDTVLCPPPPPQLVVQIQNARGADGSPLVVSPRNLSDAEFWDFNATDGSGRDPTSGFVRVATNADLWNAICKSPTVMHFLGLLPLIYDPGMPDDGTILNVPCSEFKAGWGSVIVITGSDPRCIEELLIGPCIDLTYFRPLVLPAGVTLRGNRRGTILGPQLHSLNYGETTFERLCGSCMINIRGDYVRISGLRLRGDDRSHFPLVFSTAAIQVDSPGPRGVPLYGVATTTQFIAIIDHNDISDWESAAIVVNGPYRFDSTQSMCMVVVNDQIYAYPQPCAFTVLDPSTVVNMDPKTGVNVPIQNDPATAANVRVERNFLHHNEAWGGGYGVVTGAGGRAAISGNTFLTNRHAIASDGEPHSEYRAWYNLVLTDVPNYSYFETHDTSAIGRQQDFDMHGTLGGYYCMGGYRVDIAGNTFLGGNRFNFELRGHPVSTIYFRDNVTQKEEDDDGGGVINFHKTSDIFLPPPCNSGVPFAFTGPSPPQTPVTIAPDPHLSGVLDYNNEFGNSGYADPTIRLGPASLGVGDFDGDGKDDLFLATGTAWYYSPAGATEWRFLSAKTETIEQLLLGDFDGDGRTDVVALRGGQFMVSWGGVSDWEVLNPDPTGGKLFLLPSAITAMAVGDFDGDGHADIFFADGQKWWVSYGGNTQFVTVQDSGFRVKDLRFGDFDGNGTTDVFGVVSGNWMVSYSPKSVQGLFSSWTLLRPKLTDTVDGLWVADFNGDGFADVAMDCGANAPGCWRISYGGFQDWRYFTLGPTGPYVAGIGHFLGHAEADLLAWNDPQFWISVGGIYPLTRQSAQDMH